MTPLPVVEQRRVSVPDVMPPSPVRRAVCCIPGCPTRASERHHIVNRTITGGPVDFVFIEKIDERGIFLIKNVADCCNEHHSMIESKPGGARARIRWLEKSGWGFYLRANGTPSQREGIWWFDSKTETAWEFRGFLRGHWIV